MTTLQRKRLEQLAEYHETKVKRHTFNMRDFGHCAAHNACKLFQKAGLKSDSSSDTPRYGAAWGFRALDLFFGREAHEARLFSGANPAKTPKQWAKACRKFLADTP